MKIARFVLIIASLSTGLAFGQSQGERATIECDLLAGPIKLVDPETVGPGVDFGKIDSARAIPACEQAMKLQPTPRNLALYGIALRAGRRYTEAIQVETKAADQGSALAMINLGDAYRSGQGVRADLAQTDMWYKLAAERGNPFAMGVVAENYRAGRGRSQNYGEALKLYETAADKGIPFAMVNLGYMYEQGQGVAVSYPDALGWYQKAADANMNPASASAMLHIGYMYHVGEGVTQSYSDAATWYRKGGDGGDGEAEYDLGVLYQIGRGVPKSFPDAAKWYQQAVDHHFNRAALYLGFLYESGSGVPRDCAKARLLYKLAVDYGSAPATSDPELVATANRVLARLQCYVPSVSSSSEENPFGKFDWSKAVDTLIDLAIYAEKHHITFNFPNTNTQSSYSQKVCNGRAVGGLFGPLDNQYEADMNGCLF